MNSCFLVLNTYVVSLIITPDSYLCTAIPFIYICKQWAYANGPTSFTPTSAPSFSPTNLFFPCAKLISQISLSSSPGFHSFAPMGLARYVVGDTLQCRRIQPDMACRRDTEWAPTGLLCVEDCRHCVLISSDVGHDG